MRFFRPGLFVLSVMLVALVANAQQPPQSPAELAATLHGDTVSIVRVPHPGTGVLAGRASTVLQMPVDTVMAAVTDYAHYKDFLPHFTASRVLSQRGTTAIVYIEAALLGGAAIVWAELRIQAAPNLGDTRVITCRVSHTNARRLDARWEVTPIDATKTLVTFELLVEPDLPFPDNMMSNENESGARDSVRNFRAHLAPPH